MTRSAMTRRRSRGCLSICLSTPIRHRRRRSPLTSTPPTIRCTAIRKGAFSTAIEPALGPAKPDPGDSYCYLPLYVFCGRHLLAAKLRPANIDASAGSVEELARIVAQIRRRWPKVRILLRADSGFAREALMAWCENNGIDFLFGLAQNSRLNAEIETELAAAQEQSQRTEKPACWSI